MSTHDYSRLCFLGCGRAAVIQDGLDRFCARCWLKREQLWAVLA